MKIEYCNILNYVADCTVFMLIERKLKNNYDFKFRAILWYIVERQFSCAYR